MRKLRVLDLFAGLKGWSQAFEERGHEVVSIDIDPRFATTIIGDVAAQDPASLGYFDVVLASPPCDAFTVMNIGRNWRRDPTDKSLHPKTLQAAQAIELVEAALTLIARLDPPFWVMENPRAALRKLDVMAGLERRTVTYCHYGEERMKPTDLWSDRWDAIPLTLESPCHNGDPCHVRAPRGSTTGTQGYGDSAARAKVPYALSLAVCLAAEAALGEETGEGVGDADAGAA